MRKRLHVHTEDNRVTREALFIVYPHPTKTVQKSQEQELLILHAYPLKQRTTNTFMLVYILWLSPGTQPRILPREQSYPLVKMGLLTSSINVTDITFTQACPKARLPGDCL